MIEALFVVLVWLIISAVIGNAAKARGRSGFGWFLLSACLSPLIAILLLLAFPSHTSETFSEIDDAELRKNIERGRHDG